MSVSWRHMLAGAGIATALGATALTAAGQSCNTCGPVPSPPPPPPSSGCCSAPRNLSVNVPGVNVATANVSVGATSTAVASASASSLASSGAYSSAGASGSAGGYFIGGGGGYYSNPGVAQSTISNLSVDGGMRSPCAFCTSLVDGDRHSICNGRLCDRRFDVALRSDVHATQKP